MYLMYFYLVIIFIKNPLCHFSSKLIGRAVYLGNYRYAANQGAGKSRRCEPGLQDRPEQELISMLKKTIDAQ